MHRAPCAHEKQCCETLSAIAIATSFDHFHSLTKILQMIGTAAHLFVGHLSHIWQQNAGADSMSNPRGDGSFGAMPLLLPTSSAGDCEGLC